MGDHCARVTYAVSFSLLVIALWLVGTLAPPSALPIHAFQAFSRCSGDALCLQRSFIARLSLGIVAYHLLLALLFVYPISTTHAYAWQRALHTRYWYIKFPALCGLVALMLLYVPEQALDWFIYFGLAGAGIFLISLAILTIDFAYTIHEWLETDPNRPSVCQGFATFFIYIVSIAGLGVVTYYTYYPIEECWVNPLMIGLTLVLAFVFSVTSSLDRVERGAVFVSSVVTLFCAVNVASTISFEHDDDCNQLASGISRCISSGLGSIATCALVCYASLHYVVSSNYNTPETTIINERGEEEIDHGYSLFRFHLLFATLTAWEGTGGSTEHHELHDDVAFWIKMASVGLTCVLYTWSLVAPLCLKSLQRPPRHLDSVVDHPNFIASSPPHSSRRAPI